MNSVPELRMPLGAWLASAFLVLVLTGFARRIALTYDLTDRPRAGKAHRRPTPYLGGTGIMTATVTCALVMGPRPSPQLLVVLGAATAVGVLGLLDDLRPLGVGVRLAVETLAACLVVGAGVRLDAIGPLFGLGSGAAVDTVLTILVIVGVTNAVNLLDNMDGAAAIVICVTGVVVTGSAHLAGVPRAAVLLAALSGACAGFLPHNSAPARIFMGDAGSLFIGFLLASGSLLAHPEGHPLPSAAGALLMVLVPLADTALVVLSRRRAGRSCLQGGTDHISHRLARLGLSVPRVGTVLAVGAGASALLGALVAHRVLPAAVSLSAALTLAALAVGRLLRVPVYPEQMAGGSRPPVPAVPHPTSPEPKGGSRR